MPEKLFRCRRYQIKTLCSIYRAERHLHQVIVDYGRLALKIAYVSCKPPYLGAHQTH